MEIISCSKSLQESEKIKGIKTPERKIGESEPSHDNLNSTGFRRKISCGLFQRLGRASHERG